jgi:hypothetical protein
MAVAVKLSAAGFEAGAPSSLFEHPVAVDSYYYTYDLSADGQRFLLPVPTGGSGSDPIHVMINWTAALKN